MNTAGRLLSIYTRLTATGRPNDVAMSKVWAEVFELSPESPHLEDEVVTCLQSMRSEMDLLRLKLQAIGAPEDLMRPGLDRLRDVCSTAYINQGWHGLRDQASKPENLLPFAWANWALRDDTEDEMPAEELAALIGEINSLEASLQETDMTPYLRGFIQRQIDAIRAALRVYRVRGVKQIEEALHQVAGAYTIENLVSQPNMQRPQSPQNPFLHEQGQSLRKLLKSLIAWTKSGKLAKVPTQ